MSFLKECVLKGALAGVVWGWIAMVLNSFTGIFVFEGGFTHDLVTFSVAGAVFGVVVSGFLFVGGRFVPFKKTLPRAVFVSVFIWLVLRAGGVLLSSMEPSRYHVLTPETLQGLFLAVALGTLLGIFRKDGQQRCGC
ncbi:MAG: hypothetical protein HY889_09805 [Deltaproteobacteria bacterium]|nr:hypothetical protein [Deltaproteobacteria bacterium]